MLRKQEMPGVAEAGLAYQKSLILSFQFCHLLETLLCWPYLPKCNSALVSPAILAFFLQGYSDEMVPGPTGNLGLMYMHVAAEG